MMPKTEGLSDVGLAALEYARRGWWVFPVHTPAPGGGCSCRNRDCTNPGKHPRTRNGLNDATVNLDRIASWWEMYPNANIGIACGPSGLVVIDVDPRHGGDESWRDVVGKLGDHLRDTCIAQTGGGGEHYLYTCPPAETVTSFANSDKFTGPLGAGVDVRAQGGYIVAPPSIHASGALYQWEDDREPVVLPFALLERLHGPRNNANLKLESTADILAGVSEGARDYTLFRLAARLRAVDIPLAVAYSLIEQAATNCSPPFPLAEARKKVESAYRRYEPGVGSFSEPTEAPKHENGLAGRALLGDIMRKGITEPQWVIEDVVPEAAVIVLYGEPGCGKTILDLSWHAVLAAAGRPSVFIDEESGDAMMARRLAFMQAVPEVIDQHMHYYPFPGITLADADALVAYCIDVRPALVTFDSLADMLSVSNLDENSASDVVKWMVGVAVRIAKESGAAVVLIDHNSKDVTNVRYSRGSGAKKAKADGAWYVEKTADFDEKTVGKVTLSRQKNRVGYLREHVTYSIGGQAGILIAERLEPTQADPEKVDPRQLEVLEMLDALGSPGASVGQIASQKGWKPWATRKVIEGLQEVGWVTLEGEKRGAHYVITEAGIAVARGYEVMRDSQNFMRDSQNPETGVLRVGDHPPPLGGVGHSQNRTGHENSKKPTHRDWWSDRDEDDE